MCCMAYMVGQSSSSMGHISELRELDVAVTDGRFACGPSMGMYSTVHTTVMRSGEMGKGGKMGAGRWEDGEDGKKNPALPTVETYRFGLGEGGALWPAVLLLCRRKSRSPPRRLSD